MKELARRYNARIIAEIPYSENILKTYVEGKPIVLSDYEEAEIFRKLAEEVANYLR